MVGEAPLASRVGGTSDFAREFAARGPIAGDGRSLRDLDLDTRLFRHPCSYLVGSASFAALPTEVRERFWRTIDAVVAGDDDRRFEHLTPADRRAIGEILAAVHPATSRSMPAATSAPTPGP